MTKKTERYGSVSKIGKAIDESIIEASEKGSARRIRGAGRRFRQGGRARRPTIEQAKAQCR